MAGNAVRFGAREFAAPRTAEFRTAWRPTAMSVVLGLALTGATALFTWHAFAHAIEVWSTTEEFSYGFFVPPITVALVWRQRLTLRRQLGTGAWPGLLLVVGAIAVTVLGARAGINAVRGLAVVPLLWGMVVFLCGWRAGRVLAFPIGFLVFGLGLYRGLLNSLGFALQGLTASGAAVLGHGIGLSVVQDGLVLRSDRFAFIVAEACSGMSSLLSLLALAALWIHLADGPFRSRLLVLLSVAPLVIAANVARVTLVLLIATWWGQEAALGFFHGASSLALFAAAIAGLLLVSRAVGCRTPRFVASS